MQGKEKKLSAKAIAAPALKNLPPVYSTPAPAGAYCSELAAIPSNAPGIMPDESRALKAARVSIAASVEKMRAGFAGEGLKYNCPHHFTQPRSLHIALRRQPASLAPLAPAPLNPPTRYFVGLDWLQMLIQLKEKDVELGEDFTRRGFRFVCRPVGTQHYRYCYDIYRGTVAVFVLELSPRKGKDDKRLTGILKFENHTLYGDWFQLWQDFNDACVSELIRLSRVDIALDGLNYVYDLLTDWHSRELDAFGVKLIGKSSVNTGKIGRTSRVPESYRIGTPKGLKQLAVYDKTKDIQRNSKHYISRAWELSGLNPKRRQYRTEIRLKGAYLNQLSGAMLGDCTPECILQALRCDVFKCDLFRKGCESFFEWVYCDNKNTSRCTRLDLWPLPQYNIVRTNARYEGTAYKAKMQVHNTYAQVASGLVPLDEGVKIIDTQLNAYELHAWYQLRLKDFSRRYAVADQLTSDALTGCCIPKRTPSDTVVNKRLRAAFYDYHPDMQVRKLKLNTAYA